MRVWCSDRKRFHGASSQQFRDRARSRTTLASVLSLVAILTGCGSDSGSGGAADGGEMSGSSGSGSSAGTGSTMPAGCTVSYSGAVSADPKMCQILIRPPIADGTSNLTLQSIDGLFSFNLTGLEMPFVGTYSESGIASSMSAEGHVDEEGGLPRKAWDIVKNDPVIPGLASLRDRGSFTLTFASVARSSVFSSRGTNMDVLDGTFDATYSSADSLTGATGEVMIHATF